MRCGTRWKRSRFEEPQHLVLSEETRRIARRVDKRLRLCDAFVALHGSG